MLRHARNRVVSAMGALVLAAGLGVSTASSAVAAAVPLSVTTSPVAGGYSMSPAGERARDLQSQRHRCGHDELHARRCRHWGSRPSCRDIQQHLRMAKLDPSVSLAKDTLYRATLTTAIRSGSEVLPTTTWTFTTGLAPVAQYQWPVPSSTAVEPWTIAQVTFNEVVTGVNASTFTLTNNVTGAVTPAVVSSDLGRVWRLVPLSPMAEDTWYTVRVGGGATAIRDLAGNPFAATSWTFLTGMRPLLQTWNVAPNATGVSTSTALAMGFSETITGIGATTFTLKVLSTGASVPANVTWSPSTGTWVLTPTAPLASATQYRLTLTGGTAAIRDLAGNPLASMAWNFTTG